jgi:hypothetical protein
VALEISGAAASFDRLFDPIIGLTIFPHPVSPRS